MAIVLTRYCFKCEKNTSHHAASGETLRCSECEKKEAEAAAEVKRKAEEERMQKWNAMPLEDKIDDLNKRLLLLEDSVQEHITHHPIPPQLRRY